MELYEPKMIAGLAATFLLVLAHWELYLVHRRRHLLFWALAWCCYLGRHGVNMFTLPGWPLANLAVLAYGGLAMLGSWLLARGNYLLAGRRLPRFWALALAATFVWVPSAKLMGLGVIAAILPACLVTGGMYLVAGLALMGPGHSDAWIRRLAMGGFCFWALGQGVITPIVAPIKWFYPYQILMGALNEAFAGITLLVLFYQTAHTSLLAAQDELAQAMAEKELLLREAKHRLANNLQTVWSILAIQASRAHAPEAKRVLSATQERVSALAEVQGALKMDSLYHEVRLDEYLGRLARGLLKAVQPAAGPVELALDLPPCRLRAGQAVHLGLAVSELVTNSLKYAFNASAGQGFRPKLELTGRLDDEGRLELVVRDNGPGLPPGPPRPGGLGLSLVQTLVEGQLSGRFESLEPPGAGARLIIPQSARVGEQ